MIKLRKILRSEKGLTLSEVLISVGILSIAIVGTIGVFAKCNVFAAEMKESTLASQVLNEAMEEIRGKTFAEIENLAADATPSTTAINPKPKGLSEFTARSNADLTFTRDYPITGDTNICRIRLVVDWTSPQGRVMSKHLVALVTDRGINKK